MFKKLNSKVLLLILGVLLAIVEVTQWVKRSQGDRNFKNELIKVDTAKVSSIVFIDPKGLEIKLSRNINQWSFTEKGKKFSADQGEVNHLLASLMDLKVDHVAGSGSEDYKRTGCTDSLVTKVRVEENGKQTAEFLVGGFAFQYPQSFVSYIRIPGDDEVYAIKDLAPNVFKKQGSDLRNKVLTSMYKQDITKITYTYPGDSSFTLVRDKFRWTVNGAATDSSKTEQYMNELTHISSSDFVDESAKVNGTVCTVTLEGKNFKPIVLKAEASSDTFYSWIVSSSINPTSRFDGNTNKLVEKIFVGPGYFLQKQKK